jgi:hypothetical protein
MPPSACVVPWLTDRFVFNLMLLGVLFSQVAHWATWAKKERRFIRIIVVCTPRSVGYRLG